MISFITFPAKLCGVFGATTQEVGFDVGGDVGIIGDVVGDDVEGDEVVGEHVAGGLILQSGQSFRVIPGQCFANSVVKTSMNGPWHPHSPSHPA